MNSINDNLSFAKEEKYYLASFPKSGNTWVRFLLANILFNDSISFPQLRHYIPNSDTKKIDLDVIDDPLSPFNLSSQQIIKTHSPYNQQNTNVIYIVRDGRDALTSFYHWANARRDEHISIYEIITGDTKKYRYGYGLWSAHVLGWYEGKCCKKLFVRYEDLLANVEKELNKILSFMGVVVSSECIANAIKNSSFRTMKKLEQQDGLFNRNKAKMPFIRKGTKGDWENLFTQRDIDVFWEIHGDAMKIMNYPE